MDKAKEKHLRIPKIETGIVIDHIPVGKGLLVARALGLDKKGQEGVVSLGLNFESKKLGRKDFVKVENRELKNQELNMVALLSQGCTVKRIRNFSVDERIEIRTPEEVVGLLQCPNPICVCNRQRELATRFIRVSEKPLVMKCFYCERSYENDDIKLL